MKKREELELRLEMVKNFKHDTELLLEGKYDAEDFDTNNYHAINELERQIDELDEEDSFGRFTKPTTEQLIDIAILFSDGKRDHLTLSEMVGMCNFVIDRLYENGDVLKKSSKED